MGGVFAFVGALLIGVGVGQLFDEAQAGTLIGLGAGFILWELLGGGIFRRRHRRPD